jgi:hypothetical protein
MKALSVKQPWAGNVAIGKKTAEIRSRHLRPIGNILICAAKEPYKNIGQYQCNNFLLWEPNKNLEICNVYGYAIAVVNWYDTKPFKKDLCQAACFDPRRWPFQHLERGDIIGLWAWMFRNVRLVKPFPVIGNQGIFDVEDKLIEFI